VGPCAHTSINVEVRISILASSILAFTNTCIDPSRKKSLLTECAHHTYVQVSIVQDGGLPPIIGLLRSSDHKIQAQAAGAIRNLAINVENKVRIAQEGAIQPLVSLLCFSNDEVDEQAAGALWNLAMNADNRIRIVQAGALHPCITLLRSSERRVQEQALGCIRCVLCCVCVCVCVCVVDVFRSTFEFVFKYYQHVH
jgi:hypothetical protein